MSIVKKLTEIEIKKLKAVKVKEIISHEIIKK
jgi:hypothetical protein